MSGPFDDPLFPDAKALLQQHGWFATSRLQNALMIGYNRAMWIVDRLVKEGVAVAADTEAGRIYRLAQPQAPAREGVE